MTDDEALKILNSPGQPLGWVGGKVETDPRGCWLPEAGKGPFCVLLDGEFTPDFLRALLHFAPTGPQAALKVRES